MGVSMASGPFTFAELARAAGVRIEEARTYRDRGLLQPPRRRRGRGDDIAFYAEHLERLRFIRCALGYGFSLQAVAMLVDGKSLGTCNDVYRVAVTQLEELRRDRGPAHPTVLALQRLIETCSARGSRTSCKILATLSAEATTPLKQTMAWRVSYRTDP